MDYEQYKIRGYKYWGVYLHDNQYYLGRVYIWSKREGLVDLMDTTEEERREFFEIGAALKQVLSRLFRPDLFNWASLGNITSHCHVHLVPRYKTSRVHLGIEFQDENWGKDWAPYNKKFTITEKALMTIKEQITTLLDAADSKPKPIC